MTPKVYDQAQSFVNVVNVKFSRSKDTDFRYILKYRKVMWVIQTHHSEPEDTAKVFNAVKPKLAVYSHLVFYGGQKPKDLN